MTVTRSPAPGKTGALPQDQRLLIDEVQASEMLGVSRPIFRRWKRDGLIRPVTLPGGIRRNLYRVDDLIAFAAELEVTS